MKIKLGKAVSHPSAEQVSALEVSLGTKFTDEYLNFLKGYNGAVPEANVFRVSDQNSSGVNGFIPLEKIACEVKFLDSEVSPDFFPIAYAEGGNYVCLPIAGGHGGVYFLDHEIPGSEALTRMAGSLEEFLDQLQPLDREEIKLKPGQVKKAWIDQSLLR